MRTLMLLWMATFEGQVATQYVNELEPLLQSNRDIYLSGPHTLDRQRIALDYFDQQLKALKSASDCGGAVLGAAGRRCIDHRARYGKWTWEIQSADG